MPNPSLKLTRYGMRCKPGLSHAYHRLTIRPETPSDADAIDQVTCGIGWGR